MSTPTVHGAHPMAVRQDHVMNKQNDQKQNVTVMLDREIIQKARLIAARRSISLSDLVSRRIESMYREQESYEQSERQARKLLERGFHFGGGVRVGRDELHEHMRRRG
jgi:hypothetical protein